MQALKELLGANKKFISETEVIKHVSGRAGLAAACIGTGVAEARHARCRAAATPVGACGLAARPYPPAHSIQQAQTTLPPLQLESIKSSRGLSVDDGSMSADKPLAVILSERKAAKDAAFQEQWKQMKTGVLPVFV